MPIPSIITEHTRLTIREAAELYNLPEWKLWDAVKSGSLPCERLVNGRIYLKAGDIDAVLAASRNGGEQ